MASGGCSQQQGARLGGQVKNLFGAEPLTPLAQSWHIIRRGPNCLVTSSDAQHGHTPPGLQQQLGK